MTAAQTSVPYPLDAWLARDQRPPLTAEAEANLARRALAGDRAARDELVLRNIRLVLKQAKGSRDCRQDALEAAARAAGEYDPDREYGDPPNKVRFTTYVGNRAKWAALAAKRTEARHARVVSLDVSATDDADDTLADLLADDDRYGTRTPIPTPEQVAAAAEDAEAFDRVLADLTHLQRQVVTWWLVHDGAGRARDIAAELGMTEHQVYGAWKRAKARLKARYALAA